MFQDRVAWDRPVRIEGRSLGLLLLCEKEEVDPYSDEHDRDAGTNVGADHRFFFAGDSAAVHQIADVIEPEIGRVRQDGRAV